MSKIDLGKSLGIPPEVEREMKKVSIEKLKKMFNYHEEGGNCPVTGKPYSENVDYTTKPYGHGPIIRRSGHKVTCSECGEFLGFTGVKYHA
jgi:hypothetical protein